MADRMSLPGYLERRLPVRLTDDRKIEIGAKLSETVRRLDRLEEEHKIRKAEMRAMEQIEHEGVLELSRWLANGAEPLLVSCEWQVDFEANRTELVRLDTAEVIETREISDEDRQLLLPATPEAGPAPGRSRSRGGRKREPVGEVEELPEEPSAPAGEA